MSIKRLILIPIFVMVMALAGSAHANVELISFDARVDSSGEFVVLRWRTGTEESTASFFIVRANSEAAVRQLTSLSDAINVQLEGDEVTRVPARGSVSLGARYEVIDEEVEPGETYYYMLVEIESSGTILPQENDITSVTVSDGESGGIGVGGGTTPTATPTDPPTATTEQQAASPTATQQTAGSSATPTATTEPTAASAQATATTEPTATAEPTATDAPQATSQPRASATPRPTNTPAPTRTPLLQPTATTQADYPGEAVAQVPTDDDDSSDGIFAQPVSAQEDESYPVPTLVPPPPAEGQEGYAIPTVDLAYPVEDEALDAVPINPLGDDSDSSNDTAAPTPVRAIGDSQTNSGSIIGNDTSQLPPPIDSNPQIAVEEGPNPLLWGVFIGGMLIFAAGVIGAIMIFTRQRN